MAPDVYGRSTQEPIQLSFKDALRLAGADDAFARTLLQQPEHFVRPFNLKPDQVNAVRAAGEQTSKEALTSLNKLMENQTTDEKVVLDLQDVLRLAAADNEFAQAVLAHPDDFEGPFNLTKNQVEAIRKVESLADLSDTAAYAS
ncbi:MAG: hypothetical protein WD423_10725 [Rhodothermales bacterium]